MPADKKGMIEKKKMPVKKIASKYIAIAAAVLIVILLILIAVQFEVFSKKEQQPGESTFELIDECSAIAGNIVHTVGNEGECVMKCRATCEIRSLEFDKIEFVERTNNCNLCSCHCK